MYAILVTYENDVSAEEAENHPDNKGFAEQLKKVPGFMMKTWIHDQQTYGGFYVFSDKTSADEFISSEMFQEAVPNDPANSNIQIQGFEVFDELSTITGTPSGQ